MSSGAFGGSIGLVSPITQSDLSNVTYTITMNGTDITSQIAPYSHTFSDPEAIGFWLNAIDIPQIVWDNPDADYRVYVSADYMGETYQEEYQVILS